MWASFFGELIPEPWLFPLHWGDFEFDRCFATLAAEGKFCKMDNEEVIFQGINADERLIDVTLPKENAAVWNMFRKLREPGGGRIC